MSVAESIVIFPPMSHVGWASASSRVTASSSVRPRKGPPLAVRTSLSIVPGRSLEISCCSAECSESTGSSWAPVASASAVTSSPPTTRLSLLASARSMPSPSVATVGPRPAEPTSAFRTRSHSVSVISSTSPSGPARISRSECSPARAAASGSASAMRVTPCRRACSSRSSQLEAAARPTSSRSSQRSITSSACVPIEPVEPTMRILRTELSLGRAVRLIRCASGSSTSTRIRARGPASGATTSCSRTRSSRWCWRIGSASTTSGRSSTTSSRNTATGQRPRSSWRRPRCAPSASGSGTGSSRSRRASTIRRGWPSASPRST